MLKEELQFYNSIKETLLPHHEGKFALIHGGELVGIFVKDLDAYQEGVKQFGMTPFLIQYITKEDEAEKYPSLVLGLIHAAP